MKRQISILACLLMLVAIVFAVASCTQPEAAHVHEYVKSVTKEATCTEKGEMTYTCSCGDKYTDEFAAKGHSLMILEAVAPTCTEEGKTEGLKCHDCEFIAQAQSTIAPLGHDLGAAATCTEPQACARGCGKVFVEALGHKEVAATCTEAAYCSVCNEELAPANGHKPTEATCTEPSVCTVCKEEQAPALGHILEYACLSDYCARCEEVWVEATAEHEYANECDPICMNCYEWTNMNATHNMVHVEAKEPTCTELGNIEYWTCTYCGGCWDNEQAMGMPTNVMRVKISMVDHEYFYACDAHCMNCYQLTNPEAAHSLVHVEAVAPTCTENGNIEYWYCEHCGTCWGNEEMTGVHLNRMIVILPALGHSYFYECDGWCSTCYEFTNPEAAHSIGHVAAVAPTCTENGNVEYWTCEFCGGCWDNDQATGMPLNRMMVIVSATGHTYKYECDPVCLVCYDINTEAAHNVVFAEKRPESCSKDGYNIDHWFCTYCDVHWIDEECTIITSKDTVVVPSHGYGYEYDRQCDECGLYVLPEVGEAFKLGMYVNPKKDTYYITGSLSGYYLATNTNPYKTPDFFIEEANGGFYIYFMSGNTKKYLSVQASGSYNNPKVGSTKGLFTLDEKTGALVTKTSNGNVYLGTYSNYTTVGASYTSYITGSNAANVDKTQHLLRMEILEPHDCQMSEATCKAASTCSICGKVEGEKLPHTPGAEATCTAAQTCTVCGTTITAKLAHTGGTATCTAKANCEVCGTAYGDLLPHNYVDGECSVCGEAEPAGLVNATLKFNSTANRTSYSSTQQIWEQNGVKLINDKASSTSNVGNYSNPIRLYQGSKVTIEGKGMTKVVIVRNSNSKATAANIQSYIKSANSGATVTVSGNTITVVFATPVDSFYFSCGAQVRLDSITVNP